MRQSLRHELEPAQSGHDGRAVGCVSGQGALHDLYSSADICEVIPAWGIHCWFVHALSTAASLPNKRDHYASIFPEQPIADELLEALPSPEPISEFLSDLDRRLESYEGSSRPEGFSHSQARCSAKLA